MWSMPRSMASPPTPQSWGELCRQPPILREPCPSYSPWREPFSPPHNRGRPPARAVRRSWTGCCCRCRLSQKRTGRPAASSPQHWGARGDELSDVGQNLLHSWLAEEAVADPDRLEETAPVGDLGQ